MDFLTLSFRFSFFIFRYSLVAPIDIMNRPTTNRYTHHAIDNQKLLVRYNVNTMDSTVENTNHFLRFIMNEMISIIIKEINSIKASTNSCDSIAEILNIIDTNNVVPNGRYSIICGFSFQIYPMEIDSIIKGRQFHSVNNTFGIVNIG